MKDKIPFYNIANMFFVGAVFSFLMGLLFINKIEKINFSSSFLLFCKDWSVIVSGILIIVIYEIGFILNRMSSITIAPILEKTKIWEKENYDINVSNISIANPTFKAMCTELAVIRTHILLYIIVGITSLFSDFKWAILVCILIIVVLIASGYKHNKRINIIKREYKERVEKLG